MRKGLLIVFMLVLLLSVPLSMIGAQDELPYGLLDGKPFDGTEVTFLICCPAAAQFAAWAESATAFTELTGINVTFTNDPLGGLREKIVTESLGNPGSWDVTIYFEVWGPSLAQFLDPIENYLDTTAIDLEAYPDASVNMATIDDTLYGIPVRSHVMMFYYREDVLEELGLEIPTSFDEVTAAAKAITEADNGMYGMSMNWAKQDGISLIPWTNVIRAGGGDLFDENLRPIFNSEEAIAATQWYADLLQYAPPGAPSFNEGDMRTSFASGESAMAIAWSWSYEVFQNPEAAIETVIENTGFTSVIPGAEGGSDPIGMTWPVAISSTSNNPEAALEWIKWMTNGDLDLASVANGSTVVANQIPSLASDDANAATGGFSQAMADAWTVASPRPILLEGPEIDEILETALSEIASGADVSEQLNQAAEEVESLLAEFGYYD